MYVKPTGPQGIGSVLDGSFRLLGSHFRRIWVLALIGALVANAGSSGDAVLATAITLTLVIAALSLFVGPYIVSLELVIYFDLKQRREGVDLLARAEAMS
jgi:hypothetical protein